MRQIQVDTAGNYMQGFNALRDMQQAQQQPKSPFAPYDTPERNNALATFGGPTNAAADSLSHDHATHAGQSHADWLKYANHGAIRNKPLSPRLVSALSFLPEMGIEMRVISGGETEDRKASNSGRHLHGNSADADFYIDGRKLDWNNPADVPIFQEIVRRGRANGITGIGAGDDYMGAGRMHIGFGNEAAWGAGGKGENAPAWLLSSFSG